MSAAERMPVILASRTGGGPVLQKTYGYTGGEIDLLEKGLIPAGWLDGPKARVLLSLLLRHRSPAKADIAAAFAQFSGQD
ncbi:hypothetical protein GCM10007276_18300 [Agaricicola taiwanensis]|uniref:Asparaginase/glutaminase C-terminal domain-containing protein n=1 Tax=Agaricicola taiwanensis TaxID=591372 RepID=A0A8J2W378_9RHOB|nr:hypothetical protein [Agaricicola taiwanensis]GGE41270.1 hypothetical protein GCM10007276_18300 [Agaricicola taiwanensis]